MNYTVSQGDVLNVNFNTNLSSTVIMGGSLNGGFAQDAPCELVGHLGTAASQPIALNTITGFTFSPSRAVCPSVTIPLHLIAYRSQTPLPHLLFKI
jgi:hypothetical protein